MEEVSAADALLSLDASELEQWERVRVVGASPAFVRVPRSGGVVELRRLRELRRVRPRAVWRLVELQGRLALRAEWQTTAGTAGFVRLFVQDFAAFEGKLHTAEALKRATHRADVKARRARMLQHGSSGSGGSGGRGKAAA